MATFTIGPVNSTGTLGSAYQGRVDLEQTVDAANNQSTVAWSFKIWATGTTSYLYTQGNQVTIVIDGTTLINTSNIGTVGLAGTSSSSPLVLKSGTLTVPHNSDGTKTLVVSATYRQPNATYLQTIPVNGSVNLQSIARAAVLNTPPALTLAATGTQTHTVSWTTISGYYYKVQYLYGDTPIHTQSSGTSGSSYTWNISDPASVAANVTNSKKMKVTVALHTYTDSACTNEIGVNTKTFTITFDSSFAPVAMALSPTIITPEQYSGMLVAGFSSLMVTALITYKASATLASAYAVYMDGTKELGAHYDGEAQIELGTIPAFSDTTKAISVKYTVTDSRGFSSSISLSNQTVYGWVAPSVTNVSAWRCKSNGTEDERGGYYKVKFTYTIRPLNNKNTKKAAVHYKYASSSSWAQSSSGNVTNYSDTLTLGPYSLSQNNDEKLEVRVSIMDMMTEDNATTGTFMILPARVFIDIMTDGNEKAGLGVGRVNDEADTVQFGWPLKLYGEGRAVFDPDDGITFYNSQGVVSGTYPPDGSGGGGGGSGGNGFTYAFKMALLNCFSNVAWINQDGRTYYNALVNAINDPYPANVTSISASFNQGTAVIYSGSDIDDLRQYLTVTAYFSDNTSRTVTDYLLTGTLTAGTSTITVLYGGETTTFNVTVTASVIYEGNITLSQSNTPNVISSSAITYDTTKTYSIQYTFGSISPTQTQTTQNCIVGPANSSNSVRGGAMFWSASASAWQVQTGGSATTISPAPANGDLVTVVMKFATNKLSVYVNNTAVITDATLSRDYYTNTARLIAGRENANMAVAPNHIIVSIGDIH